MQPSPSLRLRFTLACMGLVLGISSLSALGVWYSQEYVEDNLLLQLMQREVDEYARVYREDPGHLPPRSSELRSYIVGPGETDGLPAELRELPPGIWHDIEMGGRNYQVANFTLQDNRFYLTYDITLIEEREHWLTLFLVAGVLVATGLAGAVGWQLSRRVLAPVAQLAAFVERERAFTEDASHELRTPIAVVTTAAERLAGDAALPEALRPAVERIARAGQQMQATAQALLLMAREAEPAEPVMQPVPLRQVVDEALAAQAPGAVRAAPAGEPGPLVPHALAAIVIGNLLANAVQHGGAAELTQDGARVVVRDRGAGIPKEELAQVFERHYRGSRSSGSGLGLHIVRRICDGQGWTLQFDSAPGQGTAFTVQFGA